MATLTVVDPEAVVAAHGASLTAIAERAIRSVLETGRSWAPALGDLPADLRPLGASFVTLERGDELLGCIGSLEPVDPLGIDVAHRAESAAFTDPRFAPIGASAFAAMTISVSVLSALQPLPVHRPDELRAALRPGVDGLVVESGWHRATFLPSVWAKVGGVDAFLTALWVKAGLRPGEWPAGIRFARYTTATARAGPPRARLVPVREP